MDFTLITENLLNCIYLRRKIRTLGRSLKKDESSVLRGFTLNLLTFVTSGCAKHQSLPEKIHKTLLQISILVKRTLHRSVYATILCATHVT
jgi:hypothetical protein